MKHLKLIFACLLTAIFSIGQVWGADELKATLDFTSGGWGIPSSGTNTSQASFTKDGITIKLAASTNYKQNSGYLILGKANSTLELPAFGWKTTKIEVDGHSGASGSVVQNIYVGANAVSTATTGANGVTNSYAIASAYQAAGNVYVFTVTSAHNTQIDKIRIYGEKEGGELDPELVSITITGDLDTKSYEEGQSIDFAGLTATGTYDDSSTADLTDDVEWSFSPALTAGQTSVTVTATLDEISGNKLISGLTVAEHVVTPGTYAIVPNNAFWGTSYNGTDAAAITTVSGSQNDITIEMTKSGSNGYINDSQTRVYSNYTMAFSVPAGYVITAIAFTADGSNWSGTHTANAGSMTDNKNWAGAAQSVTITFGGTCRVKGISVTYAVDVKYAINFSAPANGTLVINDGVQNITSGDEYHEGDELTVTATPDGGYKLDGIKVIETGSDPENDVTATVLSGTTLTVPAHAITVSATFSENEAEFTSLTLSEIGVETDYYTDDSKRVGDVVTLPSTATACSKTFVGWDADEDCATTPTYAPGASYTLLASNKLYAVYATPTIDTESEPVLAQTLQYDTWTYSGSTTNKSSYRLFGNGAYVESSEFNLASLAKVKVFGGTFGGQDTYKTGSIGDGINKWKDITLTGTGNAKEHEFTDGTALSGTGKLYVKSTCGDGTDNGLRISKIEIYTYATSFAEYSTECQAKVATPTFLLAQGEYTSAQEVTIAAADGATIHYTTDGSNPTGESATYSGAIALSTRGEYTIKAIAVKTGSANSDIATAVYRINLPFTVSEAIAEIDANSTYDDAYVNGVISQIDSYNETYHSLTYWISANGVHNEASAIKVYSGKGLSGADFSSVDDLSVGDAVQVKGDLLKFNSSVYEINLNNELVSRTAKVLSSVVVSGTPTKTIYSANETFDPAGLVVTANYSNTGYSVAVSESITWNDDLTDHKVTESTTVHVTATWSGMTSVAYDVAVTVSEKTLVSIALGESTFAVYKGQALPKPLVTATYSEGDPTDVSAEATYDTESVYDATADGAQTITVSYTFGAETRTATYTVTANSIANAVSSPYSVAQARAIIALDNDAANNLDLANTDNKVYVQGVVTAVTANEITLKDNAEDANALFLYKYTLGSGIDAVSIGDNIKAYGNLYYFTSGSKYEMNTGCEVVWKADVAVTGVSIADATVKVGKTIQLIANILPANATNKNVTWSVKSGSTFAEISVSGVVTGLAAGDAVIEVKTEDGDFTDECTITVVGGIDFAAGDFVLVEDAAELTDGTYVIVADAGTTYNVAMKYLEGTDKIHKSTAAVKEGKFLHYNSEFGVYQIKNYVVSEEVVGLSFLNEDAENYLALPSASNELRVSATQDANSAWTVSISDGEATIANKALTARKIRYNSGSPRFACYESGQQPIALYKYVTPAAYRVYFEDNVAEEEIEVPAYQSVNSENKVTITTVEPVRDGYLFGGWKDGEANVYEAGVEYTLSADLTLYAQWTTATVSTLSYNPNGGSLISGETAIAPADVAEGTNLTIEANVYEKGDNYVFAGWKLNDDIYQPGDAFVMPANNVEFVAQWNEVEVSDYTLVTNVSQLQAGDKVIIVAADYNVAAGSAAATFRNVVDIEKTSDKSKLIFGASMPTEFTLGISELGGYSFNDGAGYMYEEEVKKVKTQADPYYWSISIDAEGIATISATTDNALKYNSGSPRFTTYASGQQALQLYRKPGEPEPVYEELREGVEAGRYYTVCLSKKVVAFRGGNFWSMSKRTTDMAFLEEEKGELPAGTPYIFEVTGTKLEVVYEGAATDVAGTNGALHGTFVAMNQTALNKAAEDEGSDIWLLSNNQLYNVTTDGASGNSLSAGRAYIVYGDLEEVSEAPHLPGRRVRGVPMQGQTATALDNAEASEKPMKMMINGQLFIIRGEKMYDATGRLVK